MKEINIGGKYVFFKGESEFERSLNDLIVYLRGFFQRYYEETDSCSADICYKKADGKTREIFYSSILKNGKIEIRFPRKIAKKLFLQRKYQVYLKFGEPLRFYLEIAPHLRLLHFKLSIRNIYSTSEIKTIKKWIQNNLNCFFSSNEKTVTLNFYKRDGFYFARIKISEGFRNIGVVMKAENLLIILNKIENHIRKEIS